MYTPSFKIIGFSIIAVAFTTGTALAGSGKDCNHKKSADATSEATMTSNMTTTVLAASENATKMDAKAKKTYTFDDALKICQDKGATDLQACVDYKTGKVAMKPKS